VSLLRGRQGRRLSVYVAVFRAPDQNVVGTSAWKSRARTLSFTVRRLWQAATAARRGEGRARRGVRGSASRLGHVGGQVLRLK
jgi:hypothetical protein